MSTQAALTRSLGVGTKTIWRWKVDKDWPAQRHADAVAAWLRRRR